jgi:hypothetical protein
MGAEEGSRLKYISLLSALHALIRNGVVGYAPGVQVPNLDSTSRTLARFVAGLPLTMTRALGVLA